VGSCALENAAGFKFIVAGDNYDCIFRDTLICFPHREARMSDANPAEPKVAKKPRVKPKRKPTALPRFHVVLLDDDDHTYQYVIEMLRGIFGHSNERGFQLAQQVDDHGRAIVMTTHKELAELKRDQIQAYGSDFRISTCKGSMSATIEPDES
jgi:ATP-dependent Clp protease adaptor protein ClpS